MSSRPEPQISPVMRRLSAYMADVLASDIPNEVAEKGKHHLLDTLGAMVSGAMLLPGKLAIGYVRGQGGTAEASVPGSDVVTSAVNAALAGGITAHADETDDSHPDSFSHPGCGVVPAALAMAEREGRSGADLLRAVVFGYDLAARSTMAIGPARLYHEMHRSSHSFAALFGAAGAAAVLAGLGTDQCRWALSYTAQQAAGVACWARDENHVEKAFDFGGMGARNGVAAATMVQAGFTGVEDVFSGPRGFFEAFGGDANGLVRELGSCFEVMNTHIKKWSVGSPIQAPLDALELLMKEHGLGPGNVASIEVRICRQEAHVTDNRNMPDVCMQHCLAVLLIDGGLTFISSHDYARMNDPAVRALRARITLVSAPDLPRREGIVTVTTADGRALRRHVPHVRGTTNNPMTRAEVDAKAADLMMPVLGAKRARDLIDAVWEIETVADVRGLRALLRG
ncbi:MAG: MmgE/PrpD family protein [Deltaproteobacteria bacterium]|nr:MmgE/PrpD family protein [Deltaproteobacteria bacterium]